MKLAKYKIIEQDGKLCLMARERGLPLLELLITEPFEVPTSVKVLCFVPVLGFSIIIALTALVVYSREFWEVIEKGDNPLEFAVKKESHTKELRERYEEAKTANTAWKEYMNL